MGIRLCHRARHAGICMVLWVQQFKSADNAEILSFIKAREMAKLISYLYATAEGHKFLDWVKIFSYGYPGHIFQI